MTVKKTFFILEFMCADQNHDKNKTNLPRPPPVTVFLIAERQLSLWLWNFQTFGLFLLIVLGKTKRNCMSVLFCIANLLEVGRKKNIFF